MSPWARIDDNVINHRKFLRLDPAAIGLWTMGLAYCHNQLSDGRIPTVVVHKLVTARSRRVLRLARELVDAGLWDVDGQDGWIVHDYLQWNESSNQVRARQAQVKQRKERYRERVSGRFGNASGNASPEALGTRPGTRPGTRAETRTGRPPNPIQSNPYPPTPHTGTRPPTPPPYLPGETDAQYASRVPLSQRPADFGDGMDGRVIPDLTPEERERLNRFTDLPRTRRPP